MATNDSANFPGPSVPIDQDGKVLLSQPWVQFLVSLLVRTGGNGVPSSDIAALLAQVQAAQAQVDYQSVQMQDPSLQDIRAAIQEILSQIPSSPNLGDYDRRLDALESVIQQSVELNSILKKIEEIESLLPEIRPTQSVLEQWNAPTLQNSWVNFGGSLNPAGYWKDPHNVVHLRGVVMSGTVNATIFLLPVGYRPANEELFSVVSNNAFGRLDVRAAGDVVLVTGSNSFASLDGITFRAAT
ncbi:hypothetical protein [Ralstonia chuxiongensis]|uniref:Uncharacterized protein n=1 Tax=Ralstonia chuxiongensis TaxID=2957504 RepID=A0AA41WYC7_9RALS|nr:hypothetical protein [Ralstonia chuxiongensis]MCP1173795.1 hypothetical protein [Ralstonia chuxiongensis]